MFIGHFGVGMAAKPAARRTSLGTLFLACQFLDLLWPTLVLLGIEKVEVAPGATRLTPLEFVYYPFSHSLLAALVWSALFGLVYFVIRRDPKGSLVCAALVTSHWLLDVLVHKPDLPLSPGSTVKIGLGLWNLPALAIGIEVAIFALGAYLYLRVTQARDRIGSIACWALIGFLVLVHAANVFGPPPPSASAVAWAGQAQWLLVLWAYWVDHHRGPARRFG